MIRELREQMMSQQSQIDALKTQLADRDAKLANAQQSAQSAEASASAATAKADSLQHLSLGQHRSRDEPQQHRHRPQGFLKRPVSPRPSATPRRTSTKRSNRPLPFGTRV